MKKYIWGLLFFFSLELGLVAQDHEHLQINASVAERCKLELSTNSVSFTRTGSYTSGNIVQNESSVQVTVKTTTRSGDMVYLRILASTDLVDSSTGQSISANSISWQAADSGYRAGTLSRGTAVRVGQWSSSGIWRGTLTFYFQDNEAYAPGTYILVVSMSVSTF